MTTSKWHDGGKRAGSAHVNLLSCAKGAVLHTWVGTPLIIVDFNVVIIDTIVGFDVSHRQYATSADRLPDCLTVHGVGSEDDLAVQTEDFTTFVE